MFNNIKSIPLKYIVVLVFCIGSISSLIAQRNPYVNCSMCGGNGYWGFGGVYQKCSMCNGSGRIVDPYIAGAAKADVLYGKSLLADGNYGESWKIFKKVVDAGLCWAHAFCAAYYELGMGVDPNHDIAWQYYLSGANAGDKDCIAAVKRIQSQGWWTPSEEKRTWFKQALKTQIEQERANVAAQYSILQNSNNSNHNNSHGNSGNYLDNSKIRCAGCNGTGRCSLCAGRGEKRHSDGTAYDCDYCSGTGSCKICGGRGYTYR